MSQGKTPPKYSLPIIVEPTQAALRAVALLT